MPTTKELKDAEGVLLTRLKRESEPDALRNVRQKCTDVGGHSKSGHGFIPESDKQEIREGQHSSAADSKSCVARRDRSLWRKHLDEDIQLGMVEINVADLVATLRGGLLRVLGSPSCAIRVFISSTFTDTASERNKLLQDVFPYLEEYARKHGYHFQGSEMRWGIREHASKENMTAEMCLEEIRDCQASDGVNFVLLSTQKYGYQPLPKRIRQMIFDEMLKYADPNESGALAAHYLLDTNSIEPEYFFDATHVNPEDWSKMESDLRQILQNCAKRAWPDLDVSDPTCRHPAKNFFISVTEMEIHEGIIQQPDRSRKCLVFTRTITHLAELAKASDWDERKLIGNFIDLLPDGTLHEEGQERLAWCKDVLIPSVYALSRQNHSVP